MSYAVQSYARAIDTCQTVAYLVNELGEAKESEKLG